MPTTMPYPNGQALVSSALTQQQMNVLMQSLTCGMLGLPLPSTTKPSGYAAVRIDWPVEGQPFVPTPQTDGCFLACVTEDNPYTRVRNRTFTGVGPIVENWTYTRGWRVSWTLYGPNCVDRARQIHSAVVFMDYFADALSLSNLFVVTDPAEPTYLPENFNAQWWPRADFAVNMYENVTETISDGVATSVDVLVYEDADLNISTNVTV
jgi:hypothetical protein